MAEIVRARAADDRVALRFDDQSWTYRAWVQCCADRAAWFTTTCDPKRPPHIGVLLDNVAEFTMWLGAAALAAALASADSMNAFHMTGRFGLAFVVYMLTVNGVTSIARLRGVITAAAIAGAIVALLVLLEYVNAGPVMDWLRIFRVLWLMKIGRCKY